jgi:diguanylate cyclase (GGDEF)-like protein/PAS domain S-box-containing protein
MKILIVDDDADSRNVLRELFTEEGYDVATAADGEEGLKTALSERPLLVISDVLMPGMDGFQLLRAIRKNEALKHLPVIFYTGSYLDDEDRELAREMGVARYLIKPVELAQIIRAVKEVLDEREAKTRPEGPSSLEEPVFLKLYNERLVSKLKHKMLESERTRLSLEHIMEGMGDGVIVITRDYIIFQANSAAAASLGVETSEMVGRKCYEVLHKRQMPCEEPHITCPLVQIFERGESSVKVLHTHPDSRGDEHHVEITASAVKDSRGEIFAIVESSRDIMDNEADDELVKLVKRLHEAQTHLKQMAITDELTGLTNRRYIVERLEEEFQRSKRSGRPLSLIMLDIDHFKQINDAYGHLFGDVVLRVIASRIKSSLRKHDLVGRVGGEEFLVVCPDSSIEDTVVVAERIRKIINDELIGDGINEVKVALSAGVTMLKADDDSADRIFSRADTALYKAKGEGRNRFVVLP